MAIINHTTSRLSRSVELLSVNTMTPFISGLEHTFLEVTEAVVQYQT